MQRNWCGSYIPTFTQHTKNLLYCISVFIHKDPVLKQFAGKRVYYSITPKQKGIIVAGKIGALLEVNLASVYKHCE